MDIQQLSVKIAAASTDFDQAELIPIFHRWIREKRLGDELLLIDVADYRHVVDGPGIMIIAHEAHFNLDEGNGQLGLLYGRKRDPIGPADERLREAFGYALMACEALVGEPSLAGKLSFDPGKLDIRVMSRLVAPNTADTYSVFEPILKSFLTKLYATEDIRCEHVSDARSPFRVRVEIPGDHDLAALRSRLA